MLRSLCALLFGAIFALGCGDDAQEGTREETNLKTNTGEIGCTEELLLGTWQRTRDGVNIETYIFNGDGTYQLQEVNEDGEALTQGTWLVEDAVLTLTNKVDDSESEYDVHFQHSTCAVVDDHWIDIAGLVRHPPGSEPLEGEWTFYHLEGYETFYERESVRFVSEGGRTSLSVTGDRFVYEERGEIRNVFQGEIIEEVDNIVASGTGSIMEEDGMIYLTLDTLEGNDATSIGEAVPYAYRLSSNVMRMDIDDVGEDPFKSAFIKLE